MVSETMEEQKIEESKDDEAFSPNDTFVENLMPIVFQTVVDPYFSEPSAVELSQVSD